MVTIHSTFQSAGVSGKAHGWQSRGIEPVFEIGMDQMTINNFCQRRFWMLRCDIVKGWRSSQCGRLSGRKRGLPGDAFDVV